MTFRSSGHNPRRRKGGRVSVNLPEPILGARRVVSLKAVTPLVLDKRWRLPGIRPVDMFWQEGRATLLVPTPLTLQQLEPVRQGDQLSCRQIESSLLPPPTPGESVVVQHYVPSATVEVLLVRQAGQLNVHAGTSIRWTPDEIAGTAILDLNLPEGNLFSLSVDCAKQWLIDSVTTVPTDVLGDWRYQARTRARKAAWKCI